MDEIIELIETEIQKAIAQKEPHVSGHYYDEMNGYIRGLKKALEVIRNNIKK